MWLLFTGERSWFRLTLWGALVGIPVGFLFFMPGGAIDHHNYGPALLLMLIGIVLSTAVAQWFDLRRYGPRSAWWPVVSVAGWVAGLIVASKLSFPSKGLSVGIEAFWYMNWAGIAELARLVAANLVMGAIAGGLTGAAIVYILRAERPPVAQEIASAAIAHGIVDGGTRDG